MENEICAVVEASSACCGDEGGDDDYAACKEDGGWERRGVFMGGGRLGKTTRLDGGYVEYVVGGGWVW